MKWFTINKDFVTKVVFAVTVLFIAWLMMSCQGCASSDVVVDEPVEAIAEPVVVEPVAEPVVPSDSTVVE